MVKYSSEIVQMDEHKLFANSEKSMLPAGPTAWLNTN